MAQTDLYSFCNPGSYQTHCNPPVSAFQVSSPPFLVFKNSINHSLVWPDALVFSILFNSILKVCVRARAP